MEFSFLDLKEKEIVNVYDGKKLGRIIDIVIDLASSSVLGIVAPGDKKMFRKSEDLFIPTSKIKRIGGDVILVGVQFSTPYSKSIKNDSSPNLKSYENYYSNSYYSDFNQNQKNANYYQNCKNSTSKQANMQNFENNYNYGTPKSCPKNISYIRYKPMIINHKN